MTQSSVSRKSASADAKNSWRLAAIDVGSNSVHMIVAQIDADGGVTTLWRMKEMVGLGRISFPGKRLSAEAMDRAAAALSRFKDAALQYGAEKIVAVATSAVREAVNGGVLIERLWRELRLQVKVVSAREEARLIYLGVRHAIDLGKSPNLIIDIGGGSVEFIVGNAASASLLESRKLGAARMTSTFVKSDPISKPDRKAIQAHFAAQLDPLLKEIDAAGVKRVIGTSGTLESLAKLCGDLEDGKPIITRKSFKRVVKQLIASDATKRETMAGLDAARKDQIVAAAILVDHLFDRLAIKQIHLCDAALREGVIVDHLAKHVPDLHVRREVPDPRRRSVLDLARRSHWFEEHSMHVTALALRLFDQLRDLHGLGDSDRELIEFASILHDIGWHISPDGHHKHAMYLIQNGGNLGDCFTAEELGVMANVARYHRKRPPTDDHESYAALGKRERRIVDVGAALLRIADGLDRSHSSAVTDVKVRTTTDGGLMCKLEIRSDAELEMWDAKRKSDWFEKLFGRVIDFEFSS